MEEKKEIKISLSTILLFISITVIIIMAVALGILYNKNSKLENKDNELGNISKVESETIVNNSIIENTISNSSSEDTNTTTTEINSTPSKTGIKLVQFDTEFYKLEDIALEYKRIDEIRNYKDFEYDLDGDGKKEKITVRKNKETNDEYRGYTFELNGKTFEENYGNLPYIYFADLNENDNMIEVIVTDDGPSDDPSYRIYYKDGSNMKKIESGSYGIMTDKKGTIVSDGISAIPTIYKEYSIISNGEVKITKFSIDEINKITLKSEYLYFTEDMKNLEKVNSDLSEQALKEVGIEQGFFEFNIIKFVEYGEMYVQLKDGRKGYLFGAKGYLVD